MLLSLLDGYYEPKTARSYDLAERPNHGEIITVAVDIAHARKLYEGCWVRRMVAFGQLSGFQQAILFHQRDAALFRRFRRANRNLHPEIVTLLTARCAGQIVVDAVAKDALRQNLVAQLDAAAVALARCRNRAPRRDAT